MSSGNIKVTSFNDGSRDSRYFNHDDRGEGGGEGGGYEPRGRGRGYRQGRGSGGPYRPPRARGGRSRGRGRGRGPGRGGPDPRSRLDDDGDEAMGGDGGPRTQRFDPIYGGRLGRGRSRGRSSSGSYRPPARDDPDTWFKITIPYGRKAEKEFILTSITDQSNQPFVPHNFHFHRQEARFYVQGRRVADAIRAVSRRVTLPNGYKMVIATSASAVPQAQALEGDTLNMVKEVLGARWNDSSKLLNLSDFHNDAKLKEAGKFVGLNHYRTMAAVVTLIKEHVPQLQALDLSDNKLETLAALSELKNLEHLQRLSLTKNRLVDVGELDKLKGLPLTEIKLEFNPLCDSFKDKDNYISAVRKRFPKVTMLDGNELAPVTTFDLETARLPSSKGSFFDNDQARALVDNFMAAYFSVYDADKRDDLLNAYHEKALFSLAVARNPTGKGGPSFHNYVSESRNLLRVTDSVRRQKQLRTGRLTIVGFLSELPKTKHDFSTMTIDLPLILPDRMITVALSGVMKERANERDNLPIRAFTRTLVLVPQNQGLVIVNDMLTLNSPTTKQISASFKGPAPTPSPSPDTTTPVTAKSPGSLPAAQHEAAVAQFTAQSGMNPVFSRQCLENNEWDYDRAAANFVQLKQDGKIPPEAFIQSPA